MKSLIRWTIPSGPGEDCCPLGAWLTGNWKSCLSPVRPNTIERRTGTLWEGRYKSSPVEAETYLLACRRYIEFNPVRAGIVPSPEVYRWSSYRGKTQRFADEIERKLSIRVEHRGRGRPRRSQK